MSDPFCQGEHVNADLQAFSNEVMPQVVMGEPFAFCQFAGTIETSLAFRNFANAVCGLWVLLLLKPFKQLFQCGIQRYFPGYILIVSASHFDGMNFQRVFLPVNIRPYCLFCFADSRAGERPKSDEVRAIFRLRCAGSFDHG